MGRSSERTIEYYQDLFEQAKANKDNVEKIEEIFANSGITSVDQVKEDQAKIEQVLNDNGIEVEIVPMRNSKGEIEPNVILNDTTGEILPKDNFVILDTAGEGNVTTVTAENMQEVIKKVEKSNPDAVYTGVTHKVGLKGMEYTQYDLGNLSSGRNPDNNSDVLKSPFNMLRDDHLDFDGSGKKGYDPDKGLYFTVSNDLDFGKSFKIGDLGTAINISTQVGGEQIKLNKPATVVDGQKVKKDLIHQTAKVELGTLATTPALKFDIGESVKSDLQGFAGGTVSGYVVRTKGEIQKGNAPAKEILSTYDGYGQAGGFAGATGNIGSENHSLNVAGYGGLRGVPNIDLDQNISFQKEATWGTAAETDHKWDIANVVNAGFNVKGDITGVKADAYDRKNFSFNALETVGFRKGKPFETSVTAFQGVEQRNTTFKNGDEIREKEVVIGGGADTKIVKGLSFGGDVYRSIIGNHIGHGGHIRLGYAF